MINYREKKRGTVIFPSPKFAKCGLGKPKFPFFSRASNFPWKKFKFLFSTFQKTNEGELKIVKLYITSKNNDWSFLLKGTHEKCKTQIVN